MPVPTDITAGTISISGSTVTGVGTSFVASDIRQGDLFIWIEGGAGEWSPIVETVTSNTVLTLAEPWTGPTISGARYRLRYQWDSSRVSAQSRQLIEMLDNGNVLALSGLTGPGVPVFDGPHSMTVQPVSDFINGVAYDVQVDVLADRAAYDGQAAGFSVLVSDVGDGRSAVYSKASNAPGDWTDPAYVTGPVGPLPGIAAGTTTTLPPGNPADVDVVPDGSGGYLFDFHIPEGEGFLARGPYSGATAYNKGDVVQNNGSSWIAKIDTTGNAPPTLPTTSNTWWELIAAKGLDGTGLVNSVVAGPGITVDNTDPTNPVISGGVTDGSKGDILVSGSGSVWRTKAKPFPQGRLTLTSGIAFPTADVAGATTIYYLPVLGTAAPIYDGTDVTVVDFSTSLALALDSNSGHSGYHQIDRNFDLFIFNDGGTIRIGSGPTWNSGAVAGSNTARGTGVGSTELEMFGGFLVNKNTISIRWGSGSGDTASVAVRRATYIGSFRTSANGQTSDTVLKRFLFNAYSQMLKKMYVSDPVSSYSYPASAFRQFNNNAANRVEFILGLSALVTAKANGVVDSTDSIPRQSIVGIGLDSTTVPAPDDSLTGFTAALATTQTIWAFYSGYPSVGYHYLAPLERGDSAAANQRFFGNGAGAFLFRPGIAAEINL